MICSTERPRKDSFWDPQLQKDSFGKRASDTYPMWAMILSNGQFRKGFLFVPTHQVLGHQILRQATQRQSIQVKAMIPAMSEICSQVV